MLPAAAFTQAVSDVFHMMSEGVKFIQYLLKTKVANVRESASGNQEREGVLGGFLFFFVERHGKFDQKIKSSNKCLLPSLYTDGKDNQIP